MIIQIYKLVILFTLLELHSTYDSFSDFILFKVMYIIQKVLEYAAVINNPQISVAYSRVVYSSLISKLVLHTSGPRLMEQPVIMRKEEEN